MPTSPDFARSARQQAHSILSQPAYTGAHHNPPRPLAGVLHAIGHALSDVFGPIWRWLLRDLFHPIRHGFHVAFGGWAPLVGVLFGIAAGALLAFLVIRRRARIDRHVTVSSGPVVAANPADLEKEADRLASMGDFAGSLRARFAAGLLRLERAGLVADSAVRTAGEVSAQLGSPTFDHLAVRHQAVAYAGDPAGPSDDDDARRNWPRVPDEARSARAMAGATR